jgi:hypothetical protein
MIKNQKQSKKYIQKNLVSVYMKENDQKNLFLSNLERQYGVHIKVTINTSSTILHQTNRNTHNQHILTSTTTPHRSHAHPNGVSGRDGGYHHG